MNVSLPEKTKVFFERIFKVKPIWFLVLGNLVVTCGIALALLTHIRNPIFVVINPVTNMLEVLHGRSSHEVIKERVIACIQTSGNIMTGSHPFTAIDKKDSGFDYQIYEQFFVQDFVKRAKEFRNKFTLVDPYSVQKLVLDEKGLVFNLAADGTVHFKSFFYQTITKGDYEETRTFSIEGKLAETQTNRLNLTGFMVVGARISAVEPLKERI